LFLLAPLQRINKSGEARNEFCAFPMEKEMLDIAALELKIDRLHTEHTLFASLILRLCVKK